MGVEISIVFDVDRNTLSHPAAQRIDDLVLDDHPAPQRPRGEAFAPLQGRCQRSLDCILGLRPVARLRFGKAQHLAAEAGGTKPRVVRQRYKAGKKVEQTLAAARIKLSPSSATEGDNHGKNEEQGEALSEAGPAWPAHRPCAEVFCQAPQGAR